MSDLQARVKNGRFVLDGPTDLPEGTEVDLVRADWWDDLGENDCKRIEESMARSQQGVEAGRVAEHDVFTRAVWHAADGHGPDLL